MAELATRADLDATRRELEGTIGATRRELEGAIDRLALTTQAEFKSVRQEIESTSKGLEGALERLEMRLTIRLGGMIAVAIAILAGIVKL